MTEETEAVVELRGALSLRDTDEVHRRLEEALETGRSVALDVRELTEVDISIVQLSIAARVSALDRGVELRLIPASGGSFRDALERFGLPEVSSDIVAVPGGSE